MYGVRDEKLIEVFDHALAASSETFDQELNDFFGMYLPKQKPILEGLMEILTQKKDDGTPEFGLKARKKTFRVLTRILEIKIREVYETTRVDELVVERIILKKMLRNVFSESREINIPYPPVDDGE